MPPKQAQDAILSTRRPKAVYPPVMSERALQAAVVKLATALGFWTMHQHDSRRTQAGWPDLVLLHPNAGHALFRELKSARGVLTLEQNRVLLLLSWCGLNADVWYPRHLADGTIERELLAASGRGGVTVA